MLTATGQIYSQTEQKYIKICSLEGKSLSGFWVVDVLGTEETSKSVKEMSTTKEKLLTSHWEVGKMLQKRQDHICEKFQVTTVKIHLKNFHLKRE